MAVLLCWNAVVLLLECLMKCCCYSAVVLLLECCWTVARVLLLELLLCCCWNCCCAVVIVLLCCCWSCCCWSAVVLLLECYWQNSCCICTSCRNYWKGAKLDGLGSGQLNLAWLLWQKKLHKKRGKLKRNFRTVHENY